MVTVSFPCFTTFGKCDSVDWQITFELTDEEYARLKKAAESGESFEDAKEVSDLFDRVYEAAEEQATADMVEYDGDSIEDYLEEGETLDDWSITDTYSLSVQFPDKWD